MTAAAGTLTVCVFCSSAGAIDPDLVGLAAEVGRAIAERGWSLVSGGGRVSMMGALARGAREAGGRTVGVIPAALQGLELADRDADELVVTSDMRTRKAEMDRRSDAFLALPGGLGTLEELLEAWTARSLGLHAKPVVVCDPTGVLVPFRAAVDTLLEAGFVRPAALEVLTWTSSVTAALDACARSG